MAGRRRQILQLDSGIGRSDRDSGGKSAKIKLETHPANPLLGMMSNYHSDEEDDHQVDSEEKAVKENDGGHVTVEPTSSKQSQLDEQVADFLRTLAASEEAETSPKEAKTTSDEVPPSSDGAPAEGQEVERTDDTAPLCEEKPDVSMWEACVDTNSGYTYYWNKETNEVSWTLPDGVVLETGTEEDEQKAASDEVARSPQAMEKEVDSPQAMNEDVVEYGPQPLSSTALVVGEEDDTDGRECDTDETEPRGIMPADEAPDSHLSENADLTEPRTFAEVTVGGALVEYHASSDSDMDSDIDDMLDRALNTDDTALVGRDKRKGAKRQAAVITENESTNCKKLKESESDREEEEEEGGGEEDRGTDEVGNEWEAEKKEEEEVEEECNALTEREAEQTEHNPKVAAACRELNRRLTLLGASTSCLHPLIVELIKLEARTTDWQNGALSAEYLMQRLQETTQLLADYEALVPPPGWTYVWDSDFERYYFYNSVTDKASWDYPTANTSADQPQQKDSAPVSVGSGATSREVSVSPPTTPPPGVDSAATPPPAEEEWQGPPPPPPPLEDGEIPPSPPTPPPVEESEVKDEDEECEGDDSYQLESGPLLYYGPPAPPTEGPPAEQEDSTPSGSRNASPAPEDGEPKKKRKKKVVKVKMHGRKGKTVSSLLQKWAGLREDKS